MNGPPARAAIIAAIVRKDLREIMRDRLWMVLTPFSLALVLGLFWLLPSRVDETITIGVTPPVLAGVLEAMSSGDNAQARGIEVVGFDNEARLAAAVSGELDQQGRDDIAVGIAFPDDFSAAIAAGRQITVSIYTDTAIPSGIVSAVSSAIREAAYGMRAAMHGVNPLDALPVALPEERMIVLGEDRAGAQVPLRERILPLLAVLILMVEAIALAGLVAVEIEQRTMTALFVTPARTSDILAAKAITGTILAASQAVILLLATGSFGDHWLVVILLVFLGAVMMSALGMISGSAGRDFMSTLFCGMFFIVPLMIPGFALLFPGSAAAWVKLIPSYGLTEAMVGVVGYGRGFDDVAPHLGATLAWDVLLFWGALLILKRKVESL